MTSIEIGRVRITNESVRIKNTQCINIALITHVNLYDGFSLGRLDEEIGSLSDEQYESIKDTLHAKLHIHLVGGDSICLDSSEEESGLTRDKVLSVFKNIKENL